MWIGVGNLIQHGTRESHQNWNVVLQSTSGCLKNKCVAVNMDNPGIACLEVARTMKSNQLLCGRAVPCKDEGLEKGNFLNPHLINYIYVYKFYT